MRLNNTDRFYSAYIQDVSPDDGPVTVFIKELGEKYVCEREREKLSLQAQNCIHQGPEEPEISVIQHKIFKLYFIIDIP